MIMVDKKGDNGGLERG